MIGDIHVTIWISLKNHLRNWILQVKISSEGKIDILLKPKVSVIFPLFIELKLLSTGRGHHCIRAVKYTSGSLCLTKFCLWTRTLEINSVCGKTYNFSLMLCVSINSIICVLGYLYKIGKILKIKEQLFSSFLILLSKILKKLLIPTRWQT